MAASIFLPNWTYIYHALRGDIDYLNDAHEAALLTNSYTPDLQAHDFFDDVSAAECADGDYAQQDLASKTITQDASKNIVYDCADIDFGNDVSITAAYCQLFNDAPATAAEKHLMGLYILKSLDLLGGTYKFTQSAAQSTEYYLEILAGGDPGISEPSQVIENGKAMAAGTAGSLTAGQWDWADNDTLGYSTVYLRLTGGDADPDGVSDLSLLTCQGNVSSTDDDFDVNIHADGLFRIDPLRS